MATFIKKDRGLIFTQAMDTLTKKTPITARNAGSIARALTEGITTEIADLYDVLDFNMSQSLISSASGQALDKIGELFGVKRLTLDAGSAAVLENHEFYFYVANPEAPGIMDVTIPRGTIVRTDMDGYVGSQISFATTDTITIPAGQKRAYVGLVSNSRQARISVGAGTLVRHDFQPEQVDIIVKCTNPKPISPNSGYETDNDFRYRITKYLRASYNNTSETMRLALLTIDGVRDVVINSAPYGLGSVEVLVIPASGRLSASMTKTIQDRIDAVRPIGTRVVIAEPNYITFNITANLVIVGSLTDQQKANITSEASKQIEIYLNSLLPNESLVYNVLIQKIMDVSEYIKDVQIVNYAANNVELPRTNYKPPFNGMIVPGAKRSVLLG